MKSAHVTYKEILGKAKRMDAPVHLSTGNHARRLIANSPYSIMKVGDASQRIWHAGRWRRVYVSNPDHGITLLGSSAILKENLENEKLVSLKYTDDLEDKRLKAGWILISCSGTIGNCAFSNAQHAEKLASQDVIRINPNNILRPGLIYAYLASRYGYAMLTQGTFGSVIQHIEPQHVESIPIPRFPESFQKEVDDLIQEAARLREEATTHVEEAKRILLYSCPVTFSNSHFKIGHVRSKDINTSLQHRLDPPALMNDGVAYINGLKENQDMVDLGSTGAKVFRPGIFKRCYVKEGYPYIKGSDIFNLNPFTRCNYLSRSRTPFVDEMLLHEGQILITCAGSVGNIKMITKEYEDKGAIGSQDIIRLESDDSLFTKEYLFTYLQLPFVYDYIQSMKYGSVIERVEPFHIASIPVLKPSDELSASVTALVSHYMHKTYHAFTAEEQAISLVEQEIERWSRH